MSFVTKPSRLTRDVAKWEKRVQSERDRDKKKRQAANKWTAISALVKARDGGCCRVCRTTTIKAGSGGDPRLFGQAHHIVYRSAGGPDELWNLVWIDSACSDREHVLKTISITGTASDLHVEPGPLAKPKDREWLKLVRRAA